MHGVSRFAPGLLVLLLSCQLSAYCTVAYTVDYSPGGYHTYQAFRHEIAGICHNSFLQDFVSCSTGPEPSVEGRALDIVTLTNQRRTSEKRKVLLVFGEHPRELVSVESFLHLMHNLTRGLMEPCSSTAGHFSRFVLNHLELHIVGLLNPDGKHRMEQSGDLCWRGNARAVDLNRNADWEFGGPGSSKDPKHEEYNGGAAFSEPEARLLRSLSMAHSYSAFASVHSGEQQLFVPFVDTRSRAMRRRRESTDRELALVDKILAYSSGSGPVGKAASSVASRSASEGLGTRIGARVGVTSRDRPGWFRSSGIAYDMNDYSADGALFDWVAGVMKTPLVLCAEIWGGSRQESSWSQAQGQAQARVVHKIRPPPTCFEQFNPPAERLQADLARIHESLYVPLLLSLIADTSPDMPGRPAKYTPVPASSSSSSSSSGSGSGLGSAGLLEAICELEQRLEAASSGLSAARLLRRKRHALL